MQLRKVLGSALLLCFSSATLLTTAQAPQDRGPQTRPAPDRSQNRQPANSTRPGQGGNRPGSGGGNNGGGRPQPGRGNDQGRPQPGAGKPSGNRPQPQPDRPNAGRPNSGRPHPGQSRPPSRPGRPAQWGRPPQNRPSYHFRPNDRDYLRRHYLSRLRYINRARRPSFVIGGFFPYGDVQYLSPLPSNLYGYLPPPPQGYQVGYFDGYVVVYDTLSDFIANVVDLIQ